MARLVHASKCICAEAVGNYLYVAVIEEGTHAQIMYRYHMVRNVWEKLPRFQTNFVRVGCMSSVNEYIYVISDSGVPQRYSLAQNDWQCGSKLLNDDQEILVYMTAVSMGSKIYVLNGCYKEEMGSGRSESSGRIWVEGGPAPVEVYNEESNLWYVVEQNRIPSNILGAVELLGGKVCFIINKFPIDSGIRIPPNEVYKISLREWENSMEKINRTAVLCYMSVKKEMLSTA